MFSDTFQLILYKPLLPSFSAHQDPAEYPPVDTLEIRKEALINPANGEMEHERIIEHVCNFIVDYINSDVLVRICVIAHYLLGFSGFFRVGFTVR